MDNRSEYIHGMEAGPTNPYATSNIHGVLGGVDGGGELLSLQ